MKYFNTADVSRKFRYLSSNVASECQNSTEKKNTQVKYLENLLENSNKVIVLCYPPTPTPTTTPPTPC